MIKTENLQKVYRTDEIETVALHNVNLSISDGEFVSVMGPSGCGKTTLLNVLGLLDMPTSGKYFFDGQDVTHYSERKRAELRKSKIGFVFQSFNLIDELTVYENVELPLIYQKISGGERRDRVEATLEKLAIAHRKKHYPQQLSGGQQQRTAVARAVVCNPKLILADEPTGNLDSTHGEEVMQYIMMLNEEGTAVVMVTHSTQYAEYAHRQIHLFDGHIVTENLHRTSDLRFYHDNGMIF